MEDRPQLIIKVHSIVKIDKSIDENGFLKTGVVIGPTYAEWYKATHKLHEEWRALTGQKRGPAGVLEPWQIVKEGVSYTLYIVTTDLYAA